MRGSQEVHVSIFESVCVVRYRDTCDDIRLACIQALGKIIVTQPDEYLKDSCLKYLGWMLNDQQSAAVRAAAVQQLQESPSTRSAPAPATAARAVAPVSSALECLWGSADARAPLACSRSSSTSRQSS